MLNKILNTYSTVSLRTPFTGSAQAQHSENKGKTDRFSEHLLNQAMAPAQLFPTSFHTVITLMSSMDSLSNTSSTTSNNKRAESKFNCLDCFQSTFLDKSKFTYLSFPFLKKTQQLYMLQLCYHLAFYNLSQLPIILFHVLIFILDLINFFTLLENLHLSQLS